MRLLVVALLAAALGVVRAAEPEAIAPEFQLFLNAQDEIARSCIYRPTPRDVVLGALKTLSQRLGTHYAGYFPVTLPQGPGEAMASYAAALRGIAADPEAVAAGWSLKNLVERSIHSYCQSLDAFSSYTDAQTWERLEEARRSDYVGIGVTLRRTAAGFFCSPFRAGAADQAGMQNGDELLEVDAVKARSMTLLEISEHLAGVPGTLVKLRVKHREGKTELLEVRREQVGSTPVIVEQTAGSTRIGFVRINRRAFEDLRSTLKTLGPNRDLVLDFRGCPGGELQYAVAIAELFLPEKTRIARLESLREQQIFVSTNRAPYLPRRLRILQDEGTASGAEIIIAALVGHPPLKAVSFGEKTFGKGVSLLQVSVARGGVLVIAESRIFGPRDEFWDGLGLPPTSDEKFEAP